MNRPGQDRDLSRLLESQGTLRDRWERIKRSIQDLARDADIVSRSGNAGLSHDVRFALGTIEIAESVLRSMAGLLADLRAEALALDHQVRLMRREHRAAMAVEVGASGLRLDTAESGRRILAHGFIRVPVIYALVDPAEPGVVHYVGQTIEPFSRYQGHALSINSSRRLARWKQQLRDVGRLPRMELIEQCAEADLDAREAYWIGYYRARGEADLNTMVEPR